MGLNVRSCPRCSKLFKHRGYPLCPDCIAKVDDDYITVRDYLYKNPQAGIQEIVDNTEVDYKSVSYLVRTGRLTFADGVDTGVHCESCGANITSGSLCPECVNKFNQAAADWAPKAPEVTPQRKTKIQDVKGSKMHIAERIQREE